MTNQAVPIGWDFSSLFPMHCLIVLVNDPSTTGKGPEGLASFGMREEEETTELRRFPALDGISLLAGSDRNKCQQYFHSRCLHSQASEHLPALPLCLPVTQLLEGVPRSVLAEDGFKKDNFSYIGCSFLYVLRVHPCTQ